MQKDPTEAKKSFLVIPFTLRLFHPKVHSYKHLFNRKSVELHLFKGPVKGHTTEIEIGKEKEEKICSALGMIRTHNL